MFPGEVLVNKHAQIFNIVFGLQRNGGIAEVVEKLSNWLGKVVFFVWVEKLRNYIFLVFKDSLFAISQA